MRSRRRKRLLRGMAIAVCVAAAFSLAYSLGLFWGIQLQSNDFLFQAGSMGDGDASEEPVMIVGIDDRSLDELGHLNTWSRADYAELVDVLSAGGARAIVFDVLFSEPTEHDQVLADSIEQAGNVILPTAYALGEYGPTGVGDKVQAGAIARSLDEFEAVAARVGHANVLPDEDGVVRRLPLVIETGDGHVPALAMTAVAEYLRRPEVIDGPIDGGTIQHAGRSIPVDALNAMIVNYVAGSVDPDTSSSFHHVSYVDVLNGDIPPEAFNDRIVLIGATALGIGDLFWTPAGVQMSGVEIHANAVHTILTGNFLKGASSTVTILSIFALVLLCGLATLRWRVFWSSAFAVVLCAAYFLVALTCFDRGVMLNTVYPPLAVVGSFVGVSLHNIATERSEKNEVTRTFGRYVSAPVVDKIMSSLEKGELDLEGEESEVTVAFADIRGFTAVSEITRPQDLMKVLNSYLSIVIECVLRHDGMVNKFGGDSIMAVWNAPTPCADHPLKAVRAALDAQHEITAQQVRDASLPRLDFGIGINSGKVIAGNLGSENRSEYSVIGDCVNVAARLTSVAEGGKVWIGADTYERLRDRIEAKPLEALNVKGKAEAVEAYEVVRVLTAEDANC